MDDTRNLPGDWVTLAQLLRPQGRKGELLAELRTDFPERLDGREGVFVRNADGTTTATKVEAHWLPVGRNAGRIVLKLLGIDSINAAEPLAGSELVVQAEQRLALDEQDDGAEYIANLLDCALVNGDRLIGTVHDVHFPTSPLGARLTEAAPLLVVHSTSGNELLIPFVKAWIDSVDIAQKRITMRLPEGLLDING